MYVTLYFIFVVDTDNVQESNAFEVMKRQAPNTKKPLKTVTNTTTSKKTKQSLIYDESNTVTKSLKGNKKVENR